jgi:hypothetical protein
MSERDGQHPWSTVCHEHQTAFGHPTILRARRSMVNPSGWCAGCARRTSPDA